MLHCLIQLLACLMLEMVNSSSIFLNKNFLLGLACIYLSFDELTNSRDVNYDISFIKDITI
jgi:hypothetical protein